MSIEKITQSLPPNEAWRLINLRHLFYRSKIDEYCFTFQFQRIGKCEDISKMSLSELQGLNKYKPGRGSKYMEFHSPYLKGLITGSIWWRDINNKVSVAPPSAFLEKVVVRPFFSEKSQIKHVSIDEYLYPTDVPHFSEKAGAPSRLTSYELENPLKITKSKLRYKEINTSSNQSLTQIDFIAFYSYEIIRYFFTSKKIDDLNYRIFSSCLIQNSKLPNLIYDASNSYLERNIETDETEFKVLLSKKGDEYNIETIGNIASEYSFKQELIKIQNYLRLKRNTGVIPIQLPLKNFSNLEGYATIVKSYDQQKTGILFSELTGYDIEEETQYRPIFEATNRPKPNGVGGKKTKNNSKSGGGTDTSVKNTEYNHNNNTNEESEPQESNIFSFDKLFNQESNVKILKLGYINSSSSGNDVLEVLDIEGLDAKGEPTTKSKTPGDGKENDDKLIDPTNYFAFFPKIISAIETELKYSYPKITVKYLNHNCLWQNKPTILKPSQLKTKVEIGNDTNWQLYVVRITVSNNRFYIFEKWTKDFAHTGRSWIYSLDNFAKADEIKIVELVNNYIFDLKAKRDPERREPNNGINHLHLVSDDTKKKGDNNSKDQGKKTKRKITEDEAIQNHKRKIVLKINDSLS